jgi:hypothetical protein
MDKCTPKQFEREDETPAAWDQEIPLPRRKRGALAVVAVGIVVAGLIAGAQAVSGVEWQYYGWSVACLAVFCFFAYGTWTTTSERVYRTQRIEYRPRERLTRATAWFAAGIGGTLLILCVQAFNGSLDAWWYAWPMLAFVAVGVFKLFQSSETRLTPAGAKAKAADAQSASRLIDAPAAEPSWFDRLLEQWWVRYPLGVIAFFGAYWYTQLPSLKGDWRDWLILAGLVVFGAWLTREISKWLLGLGLLVLVGSCVISGVQTLSTPVAIIVGALIVAAAISANRK